jgi:hypothetical protein
VSEPGAPVAGPAERFGRAAFEHDVEAMYELVDWGVTGASTMVGAMAGLEEPRRSELARLGLGELNGEPTDAFSYRLAELASRLQAAEPLRPATPAEVGEIRAELAVPPVPDGTAADVAAALGEVRARAEQIREASVADRPGRSPVRLAVVGDTGRIALA